MPIRGSQGQPPIYDIPCWQTKGSGQAKGSCLHYSLSAGGRARPARKAGGISLTPWSEPRTLSLGVARHRGRWDCGPSPNGVKGDDDRVN